MTLNTPQDGASDDPQEETLDDILEDLSDLSTEDAIEHTSQIYDSEYLAGQNSNALSCHDGDKVIFYRDRFEHAFYTKSSSWGPDGDKSKFCRDRGSKIKWIASVLKCRTKRTECWLVENERHGRPDKRLYISWPKGYVVWLEPTRHECTWKFSTAYSMTSQKIRERCKMGRRIGP